MLNEHTLSHKFRRKSGYGEVCRTARSYLHAPWGALLLRLQHPRRAEREDGRDGHRVPARRHELGACAEGREDPRRVLPRAEDRRHTRPIPRGKRHSPARPPALPGSARGLHRAPDRRRRSQVAASEPPVQAP